MPPRKKSDPKDKSFAAKKPEDCGGVITTPDYRLWTPEELQKGYESGEIVGWKPDYRMTEKLLRDEPHPSFAIAAHEMMRNLNVRGERQTTLLYEHLLFCNPDYQRGAQGIGDCVSWGGELAETILIAKHFHRLGTREGFMEAATEPNYGGSRVEALGKKSGGYSDGSWGYAMARWAKNFGAVFRKDYSQETGNPETDLTAYSAAKAKAWGNFGCGGKSDSGKLDAIARAFPVKTISQCRSFDDVAAAIEGAHCPVTIASDYGTDMVRDKNGFCKWNRSWPHQMVLIGVRFGDTPGALCAQSWGPRSVSGPKWPVEMPDNIAGFTWWIPAKDVDKICQDDCWAFGDMEGWALDPFDYSLWA